MISQELILKVSRAIASAEGFGVAGAVPTRAHNPGDITDDGDVGLGVIHTGGPHGAPITIYGSDADGWSALYRKVGRMLRGASHVYLLAMSLEQVGLKWSGDPAWPANVARELGVSTSARMSDLVSFDLAQQSQTVEAGNG